MPSLDVTVTVKTFPTESEERIMEILRETFPGMEFQRRGDYIIGKGNENHLENLLGMIGREKIAARAYALFKKRKRGDSVLIPLERDPLAVKRISFGEDGEFPPIWVEIRGDVDAVLARLRDLADLG